MTTSMPNGMTLYLDVLRSFIVDGKFPQQINESEFVRRGKVAQWAHGLAIDLLEEPDSQKREGYLPVLSRWLLSKPEDNFHPLISNKLTAMGFFKTDPSFTPDECRSMLAQILDTLSNPGLLERLDMLPLRQRRDILDLRLSEDILMFRDLQEIQLVLWRQEGRLTNENQSKRREQLT